MFSLLLLYVSSRKIKQEIPIIAWQFAMQLINSKLPAHSLSPHRGACVGSVNFVLVMGALCSQIVRTMAWKAHGKNHDDLMTQLKRKLCISRIADLVRYWS